MLKRYAKSLLRPAWSRLRSRVESIAGRPTRDRVDEHARRHDQIEQGALLANEQVQALRQELAAAHNRMAAMDQMLHEQIARVGMMRRSVYAPDPADHPVDASAPFMAMANCQASDFFHPRYAVLCKLIAARPQLHRKQWEWVYVLHHLIEAGVLREDFRGLGFGVGTEPLPAVFASLGVEVTATDAPDELDSAGWRSTNQHSGSVDQLLHPAIALDDLVRSKVRHQPCDMNNIDPSLAGYDFNWSSCCFEHLGSLEHGLQFVINAVEKTLKVGGIAVHTTEYNASSNDATLTEGDTVIFRRRDMEDLVRRLREHGHEVQPFIIGPPTHALDYHVDVPPYSHDIHLKLLLASYVATSVGIVVRRGI